MTEGRVPAQHDLDLPGLTAVVAGVPVVPKHRALVETLRRASDLLAAAKVTAVREVGAWLERRKVLTASGQLVHEDHRAFLQQQLESAGSAEEAERRLRSLDYRLSRCNIVTLYIASDQGGPQDAVIQAVIDVEQEIVDCRLFSSHGPWRTLRDLNDLCVDAEGGEPVTGTERVSVRPESYRLRRVTDLAAFIRAAETLDVQRRRIAAGKTLTVTDLEPGAGKSVQRGMTVAELDPGLMKYSWRGRRLIDDWTTSSAGRSGARLSDHWAFQLTDHTSAAGERWMDLVPVWVYPRKLAEVAKAKSDYELYGKLEVIDRRVGVPFAWYFWMLHGNRVHSWAGERVLGAAERGLIVLPEHDYRVLRRWGDRQYGF